MSIEIYTDGSAVPNPGNGGWGFAIFQEDKKKTYCGFVVEKTTNNKMEIMAITKAIEKAEQKFDKKAIIVYTDSNYVKDGLMGKNGKLFDGWIKGWLRNGWKNAKKQDVKNKQEWQLLYNILQNTKNKYDIQWVKAHADNKRNEIADELANMGRKKRFN